MYLIAAIKMVVCLVEIIDDDVSENHCFSNCSSTKTVISSNLSQHILTWIIAEWHIMVTTDWTLDWTKQSEAENYPFNIDYCISIF